MNLTLTLAVLLLAVWIVLAFLIALPSGWVHLCYAGGMLLVARRVVIGAPRFLS